jgi:hypothetical protein
MIHGSSMLESNQAKPAIMSEEKTKSLFNSLSKKELNLSNDIL